MAPKKRTRRSTSKYPALDPHLNLKTRFEQLDFDYIDQLPETWTDPKTGKTYNPKQYLNDFANEFVHADFTTNKKRIHKKKKVESDSNKYLKKLSSDVDSKFKEITELINNAQILTKSKIKLKRTLNQLKTKLKKQIKDSAYFIEDFYKKEAEHQNNARNRCILTRSKAQGKALGIDELSTDYYTTENVEDEMIERLDSLKESQESEDDSQSS